ncbi:MAG: stalk domain-containing protein [Acetivibrionales bacterium]|jgi:hypothetical protein
MKKTRLKILTLFVIVAFVTLSAATIGYAAGGYKKTIEAWFGLTNISYNGQDLTQFAEPFAVNDTTYMPLRKMCDMFKKDIEWDQATHTVIIKDRPTYEETELKNQITLKDYQISQLESKVAELEKELNFYESRNYDDDDFDDILEDLEDDLNDDYDEYRGIEFKISLDGDEDEIEVEIEVDLDDFEDEWEELTNSRKIKYLQDICDEILDEFDDADIEGTIIDSSKSKNNKLLSFYTDKRGKVVLGSSIDSDDLKDLEDDLYDYYYDWFRYIEFESIELDEDDGKIIFTVEIDLDEYDDEWDDLTDAEVKEFMYEIRAEILDEFDDVDVEGVIYDIDEDEEIAWVRKVSGGTKFERD